MKNNFNRTAHYAYITEIRASTCDAHRYFQFCSFSYYSKSRCTRLILTEVRTLYYSRKAPHCLRLLFGTTKLHIQKWSPGSKSTVLSLHHPGRPLCGSWHLWDNLFSGGHRNRVLRAPLPRWRPHAGCQPFSTAPCSGSGPGAAAPSARPCSLEFSSGRASGFISSSSTCLVRLVIFCTYWTIIFSSLSSC